MKNSQLIELLGSFSNEEMKEFGKFIESPFTGCRKFVVRFFKVLARYHPEFNENDIRKEALFRKLYKEREFNDALVRRMTSDLIHFAEDFLRLKNFKGNRTFQNATLLGELQKRNLRRIFKKKFAKMDREIADGKALNSQLTLESFLLHTEVRRFRTALRDDEMNRNFSKATEAITVLFIEAFYSYINHIRTFESEYRSPSEMAVQFGRCFDFRAFMDGIHNLKGIYPDYLRMIHYRHEIITDPENRESYEKLKKLLQNKNSLLEPQQIYNCLVIMSRFCSHQNLHHNNSYLKESFRIHDLILKEKYFLLDASLMQLSFCRNLVTICKSMNKFTYIRNFISQYSEYFHDEYKEGFLNYCKAVLLFSEKKYADALKHAILINIDKPVFKKDVKIIKLKTYYELGYTESLFSEIDALKHLLSGMKSLKGEISFRGKSFAELLSRVAKIKSGNRKEDPEMLRGIVQAETRMNEKAWLLEKLDELIK